MHTSDKSGIIDSMTDEVPESKRPAKPTGSASRGWRWRGRRRSLPKWRASTASSPQDGQRVVFGLKDVSVSYSGSVAIRDVDFDIHENLATAFIGPSGCGKTTLLRSMNRMNDLIDGAEVAGKITYHGHDLFGSGSTRSRCAVASGWCSSDPIRSRSRSTTTSRSACACTG